MIDIYKELQDIEQYIDRVKESQNHILDMYDPNSLLMKNLLKELSGLQQQYEKLRQDFIDLSNADL